MYTSRSPVNGRVKARPSRIKRAINLHGRRSSVSARRRRSGDGFAAARTGREHQECGQQAEGAGEIKGGKIRGKGSTGKAGAEGGGRGAELMRGENPAEDDPGALAAEGGGSEPDGRRHRGDPIEPIEHRKE